MACALLACQAAAAQSPSPSTTHVVSGTVFDSVAQLPLSGAVVQLARVTSGDSAPQIVTAITDAAGRFRFAGLPSGRFAIGFQHDALNALGIESPLRAFELGADTSVTMNLAIESGPVVRVRRCGKDAAGTGDGMIAGYVLDARRETTLGGAKVYVHWLETELQRRGLHTASKRLTATVSEDGRYLACGVPSDAAVDFEVTRTGYRGIVGQMTIPAGGATRQDFRLADSGVVRGASTISGRVMQQDRTALPSGVAAISALAIEGPVRDGAFSMTGLPAGTWFVEVKAIGYEPQSLLAQAAEHANTPLAFVLSRKAQTLEAVSVIGQPGRDTRILDDIVTRNKVASGTMFLPGNSWLASADTPADVLRAAHGFRYKSPVSMFVRGCGDRPKGGDTLPINGRKDLAVYLDGMRLGTGLQGLSDAIAMRQVLAIEAYPDVQSAPFLWRTNDACAVVAVWTKR